MNGRQPDRPESVIAEKIISACDAYIDRVGGCDGCPDYLSDEGRCRNAPPDKDIEIEIDK